MDELNIGLFCSAALPHQLHTVVNYHIVNLLSLSAMNVVNTHYSSI